MMWLGVGGQRTCAQVMLPPTAEVGDKATRRTSEHPFGLGVGHTRQWIPISGYIGVIGVYRVHRHHPSIHPYATWDRGTHTHQKTDRVNRGADRIRVQVNVCACELPSLPSMSHIMSHPQHIHESSSHIAKERATARRQRKGWRKPKSTVHAAQIDAARPRAPNDSQWRGSARSAAQRAIERPSWRPENTHPTQGGAWQAPSVAILWPSSCRCAYRGNIASSKCGSVRRSVSLLGGCGRASLLPTPRRGSSSYRKTVMRAFALTEEEAKETEAKCLSEPSISVIQNQRRKVRRNSLQEQYRIETRTSRGGIPAPHTAQRHSLYSQRHFASLT